MDSLLKENFGIKFAISLLSLIILVSLFLLSRDFLYAGTNVSGTISTTTSWDVGSSPYTVTGHVTVASGVTLTIDPGVTVKFDNGKIMIIEGELIAKGNSGNRIIFTSSAASPAPGDWGHIRFKDSSTDATFDGNGDYQSGSILEYVTVKYGDGVYTHISDTQDTGAIWADYSSPFINHSIFEHNEKWAIFANPEDPIKITNNTFQYNANVMTSNLEGTVRVLSPTTISTSNGTEIHVSNNTFTDNGCVSNNPNCSSGIPNYMLTVHLTTASGITTYINNNTISY